MPILRDHYAAGKPSQDSQGRIKHMRYLSTLVPKPRPNRVGSQSQGRIEHVCSHSSKGPLRYDLGILESAPHGPQPSWIKHVRYLTYLEASAHGG